MRVLSGFPKRLKLYANHFLTHKRHLYEIILNSLRFLHIGCRSVSACILLTVYLKKGTSGACVCTHLCSFLNGIKGKKIPHKHRRWIESANEWRTKECMHRCCRIYLWSLVAILWNLLMAITSVYVFCPRTIFKQILYIGQAWNVDTLRQCSSTQTNFDCLVKIARGHGISCYWIELMLLNELEI